MARNCTLQEVDDLVCGSEGAEPLERRQRQRHLRFVVGVGILVRTRGVKLGGVGLGEKEQQSGRVWVTGWVSVKE